jgi:uncharacterized protein YndB with AHSA1/START domain
LSGAERDKDSGINYLSVQQKNQSSPMSTAENKVITVKATVEAPIEKVWKLWTDPVHIIQWNNASDDWHTPRAENDLRTGGSFLYRMEARDGSMGFDFIGEYINVELHTLIEYVLGDGRKVQIRFVAKGSSTDVTESFEAEDMNSIALQHAGWQAILNNFKHYAER